MSRQANKVATIMSNNVLELWNFAFASLRVGGDFWRWLCRHVRRKISAHIDGGPSRGSSMRRPRSEDPHRRERKFLDISSPSITCSLSSNFKALFIMLSKGWCQLNGCHGENIKLLFFLISLDTFRYFSFACCPTTLFVVHNIPFWFVILLQAKTLAHGIN